MKRIVALMSIVLTAFGISSAAGVIKVLERSSKTVPDWIASPPHGYIVAEVEAPEMRSAKDKAVDELALRVIMSVATNVVHSSTSSGRTENIDGKVSDSESFGFDTKIVAAKIPFIQGISLSEAKDSYWEKCQDKNTNRIFYRYAVLYPLPDSRLESMRNEFEKTDRSKTELLNKLKADYDQVTSTSQIEMAVAQLEELKEYFFDDVRRKEAEGLYANYKKLYKGLTLQFTKPKGGRFTITLTLHGRPFEVTGVPTLKSNCASKLQASPLEDNCSYEVTYDATDCLAEEDNWIEITLRLRDTRISQKVYL